MNIKNFFKNNIFIKDIKRIKKNLYSFISDFFSRTIVQVFYYPLMLLSWGIETTGTWLFLSSIPVLMNVLSISPSLYVRQKIIITNKDEHDPIYSNSLFLLFVNNIIFLFIFYLFSYFFLENFEIIKSYSQFDKSFMLLILIIGLATVIESIANFFYMLIDVKGKIYYKNYIENIIFIIRSIAIVISGFYLTNIIYISLIFITISLIKIIIVFYVKNRISNIKFNSKYIKLNRMKDIFNESFRYHLLNFKGFIDNSGLNFIVGLFFNAEILIVTSTLSLAFKLFYSRFVRIIEEILLYEYANNLFHKNKKKIILLVKSHNYFILFFSTFFIILVYFLGEKIYNLWTLNKFVYYNNLILLASFEAITLSYFNANLVLLKSINRIKDVVIFNLFITLSTYVLIFVSLTFLLEIKVVYYFMIANNIILFIFNMNQKDLILRKLLNN